MPRWLLLFALAFLTTSALCAPSINIQGVDGRVASNVRQHIGELTERDLSSARRLRQRLERTVPRAMQALGYYHAEYQASIENDTLLLTIEPGERMVWSEPDLAISGPAADQPAFWRLQEAHPFQPGSGVEHDVYDEYRDQWLQLAYDQGYFDARLSQHVLEVDPASNRATARIHMESGERYRYGETYYEGSGIDDRVLRRMNPLEAGQPYEREPLRQLHRDLQATGYFDRVAVRTEQHDDRTVTALVELEDAARHRYSAGIGFGTDTGPRTRLRWERPRVNRAGHYLMTEAQLSRPVALLTAEYRIPLHNPLTHFLSIGANHEQKDVEDTESIITNLGVDLHQRLDNGWLFSYGVRVQDERYRQGQLPRRTLFYVIPGAKLTYMDLEPGIDPTRGHRSWLETAASHPQLGSDTTFLRALIGHKRLLPLGRDHLLIARAEAGIVATTSVGDVPVSQRFFTGGDQTLRGFDFESIGPRDDQGNLIGGRYLNLASLEYSFRVAERWRLAAFTDAGRAFNSSSESWRYGAGVGVRWLSPVGQIRLDVAVPVMDDEESGFRLHLFMGPPL